MKLRNIAIGLSAFTLMTACNELQNTSNTEADFTLNEVTEEVEGLSINLEVKEYTDNLTEDALERGLTSNYISNARTTGSEERTKKGKGECGKRFHVRHYMDCAEITKTEEGDTKTVVIDFSNGACESKDGETVSGIVTEVHTRTEGSVSHSSTFEDFTENGKVVNGTVSMNGTMEFEEMNEEERRRPRPTSSDITKSVNLSLSFAATDTTEAYTEQISRTVEEEMLDGVKTISGTLTVTSSLEGESFTTEITEPLTINPRCGESKPVFAPISGVEVMTKGDETITINYGDGTCDFLVDITLSDGTTETIDLKEAYDEYGFKGVVKGKKGGRK